MSNFISNSFQTGLADMGPCNDNHRQSIAIRYSKMINGLLSAHYYTKNSKVLLSV